MLNEKNKAADYSNIKFLYRKSKKILSKNNGGLSRNDITNSIIGDDWKKYSVVYRLLKKVFEDYEDFKREKGKYFLKPNLT